MTAAEITAIAARATAIAGHGLRQKSARRFEVTSRLTIYPMNSNILEGVSNRIKVIKRMAYGFRDSANFPEMGDQMQGGGQAAGAG